MKLILEMNTDDDLQLLYKGVTYCFYDDNLNVEIEADTLEECVDMLLRDLEIPDGWKVTEMTKEWLFDNISRLLRGEDAFDMRGNQEYSMYIID